MEFTAVIVCGKGKALSPFSQIRSTGIPKALLPIANKPMVQYVLDWCFQANFAKVVVVSEGEETIKKSIESAVNSFQEQYNKKEKEPNQVIPNVEVISFDCENNGSIMYELYQLYNRGDLVSKNFILLPCDLITNLPPQVIIEAYRNKEDSDLGLFIAYKNQLDIEDKKNKIFPNNYTIYSENDAHGHDNPVLLDVYNYQDIEFHQALSIRTQMCWRYPASTVSNKLLNSGIFIGSCKDIFKIFDESKEKHNEAYFEKRSLVKIIRDLSRRSWKHSQIKENVGLFIVPKEATFFRSNNLPVLMEANRYFMKLQAMSKAGATQQQQQPKKQDNKPTGAHIGNDSLVGENTELGERTNVKRSVIGSNCKIGKKNRITGCLILDNVEIGDDVTLENCIIGHDVIIQTKCKLTSCNVESTNEVVTNTQAKNTNLLCLTLEGLVDGEEYAVDSSDELDEEDSDEDESTDDEEESEFEDEYTGNEDGLFAY